MAATSVPASVDEYLATLPGDRRETLAGLRATILANLPEGYEEGIQYGTIGYFVPHSRFPQGYHCDPKQPLPFASIASRKNHSAIYLFCIYMLDETAQQKFREDWVATGRKLDMGKGCIRFKKLDDLALDLISAFIRETTVDKFLSHYARIDPRQRTKSK